MMAAGKATVSTVVFSCIVTCPEQCLALTSSQVTVLLSQKLLCDHLKKYQSDCAGHPGWLSPVPPLLSHRLPITPHPPFLGLGALSLPRSGPPWVLPSPAVVFFHMDILAWICCLLRTHFWHFSPYLSELVCSFEDWCVFMWRLLVGATLPWVLLPAIPWLHQQ